MVNGEKIADWDRSFARLDQFLRSCDDATAQALAASRFLATLPAEQFLGRSYYLEELAPRIISAVRSDSLRLADPEIRSAIHEGLHILRLAQLVEADELEALRTEPSDSVDTAFHQDGSADVARDANEANVPIPVCLEPPPPFPGGAACALGKLARLIIRPRAARAGQPELRWPSHPEMTEDPRLRPLYLVARDAAVAARAAVPGAGHPGFDLDFEAPDAPIAGDSAGLGMAAAMAGIMSATVPGGRRSPNGAGSIPGPISFVVGRGRTGLRPRGDLAWTGTIRTDGTVGPVDPSGLRAKVRAAYYGGSAGLVVSGDQVDIARREVPLPGTGSDGTGRSGSVSPPRPHQEFEIHGVHSLQEALADPTLFEPWSIPLESLQTPWHRRGVVLRWATVGVLVSSLAMTASTVHRNAAGRRGPHASLSADCWSATVTFDGGARPLVFHAPRLFAFAGIGSRLPGDPSGEERLVLLTSASDSTLATLSVRELHRGNVIWEYAFRSSGLPIEFRDVHPECVYNGKAATIGDLDGDGDEEIVVSLTVHPSSDCILRVFDTKRVPEGALYHKGHLEGLLASDLNGDGRKEIVATGLHSSSMGVSVLLLRRSDFRTDAKSAVGWDMEHQPCLAHFVFPRPRHLMEELGIRELAHVPSPQIVERPDASPLVTFTISLPDSSSRIIAPDYLIYLSGSPPGVFDVTANANLTQASLDWIRSGRCRTDFSSPAFIEEWRRSFQVFDHVDLACRPVEPIP